MKNWHRALRERIGRLSGLTLMLFLTVLAGRAQTLNTVVMHSADLAVPIVEPHSVAVDAGGAIYFTDGGGIPGFGDSAHRVVRYDTTKSQLSVLAGDLLGRSGTNSGVGFNARFFNPAGIVAARGGLVVADSGNHFIRFVGFDGSVSNIAGAALQPGNLDGIGGAARFNTPLGLAVDGAGNLYVADSKNNSIRRIAPDNTVSTYAAGFNQPNGVAVGDNGELWVADTLNHQIKTVATNGTVTVRAGLGVSGFADSFPNAAEALFSSPRGVFWMGAAGLLIADSGNHIIRRLYTNSATGTFSIETSVGGAGEAGFANGATSVARLSTPLGITGDTLNGAFLVVDVGNRAIRRVQQTAALPPVSSPRIGYVVLAEDSLGNVTARLQEVVHSVFNNEVPIQIVAENGVDTYFTFGDTPTNVFIDTLPDPSSAGVTVTSFTEGGSFLPGSIIANVVSDMTVKAQSSQPGRESSGIVSARFQFKVGNPIVVGDNAANFTLGNVTTNAEIYYTIDGTEPTNAAPSLGPVTPGASLSFNLTSTNLLFKARAFKTGFEPSAVISNLFSSTDFTANRISFGFESGPASSSFTAAAGSTFYAPVTLSLADNAQVLYSLQFGLIVTNDSGVAIAPGGVAFQSHLGALTNGFLGVIPPTMFVGAQTNVVTVGTVSVTNITPIYTNLLTTNTAINLLSVGWLEIPDAGPDLGGALFNLFDVANQHLISYSRVHDYNFNAADGRVAVGGYGIQIPTTAAQGQQYKIKIIRPSGAIPSADIFIDAPTNGNETGSSPINSVKVVTVGAPPYLVGDVYPFQWWNAGDFGDSNLLSVDVVQVYRPVMYNYYQPLPNSDFFDAMDSCCGTATVDPVTGNLVSDGGTIATATLSQGTDTAINSAVFGDGTLDIADIWVTFRRSLDPTLTNYMRFRSNGVHYAVRASNLFRGQTALSPGSEAVTESRPVRRQTLSVDAEPAVSRVYYSADSIVGNPGELVVVPIRANVVGSAPLRILALNLSVVPVKGSDSSVPQVAERIEFLASAALGEPATRMSIATNNIAAVWLNPNVSGIVGDGIIGHVRFRIPASAGNRAAYVVRFDRASGASFGIDRMPGETVSGLVSMVDRTGTNTLDGLPDDWRMRHFEVASIAQNLLAAATADADGDGLLNWQEELAGTNPNLPDSSLQVGARSAGQGDLNLRWPTRPGRRYRVEFSTGLINGTWTPTGTPVDGDGSDAQISLPSADGVRFYRVRLVDPEP